MASITLADTCLLLCICQYSRKSGVNWNSYNRMRYRNTPATLHGASSHTTVTFKRVVTSESPCFADCRRASKLRSRLHNLQGRFLFRSHVVLSLICLRHCCEGGHQLNMNDNFIPPTCDLLYAETYQQTIIRVPMVSSVRTQIASPFDFHYYFHHHHHHYYHRHDQVHISNSILHSTSYISSQHI
jgi:hypothetical protein